MSLQYIHSKDIVHLNINFANILMLAKNGEELFEGDNNIQEDNMTNKSYKPKNNILFINFCQAGQYSKKLKFNPNNENADKMDDDF